MRACFSALVRLDELTNHEERRSICRRVAEVAGVLCLASGALWTPLLDAVWDAYSLRCGGCPDEAGTMAPQSVVSALASALRQCDGSRLALRLLRRWRSPAVHGAVLHYGLRRITPALARAVLALPSTTIAELSRVPHSRTPEWQRLLDAARRELLRRLELINPTSADAQALVGALAEITVACNDLEQPLSHILGAIGWKPQLGVGTGGAATGAPRATLHCAPTADNLRQLSRAIPVPDAARGRRPFWDERTRRAIQRVIDRADAWATALPQAANGPPTGIRTWLALALRPPITPSDAQHVLEIARRYASWRPGGYAHDEVPPLLTLLAYEGIPDAVVVQVASTLSDTEWTAAVPALVHRSAVRTNPAFRQRLARADSAMVQAVLALDEPLETLGERLRALFDRDPEWALAAIDVHPDATRVLRRNDVLPLLRCPTGSVRRDAAALLHQLEP